MFSSIKIYIMIAAIAFAFASGWKVNDWKVGAAIAKAQAREMLIMREAQKLHIAWEASRQKVRGDREVRTIEIIREVRINVPVNPQCDLGSNAIRVLNSALTDTMSTTPIDITN